MRLTLPSFSSTTLVSSTAPASPPSVSHDLEANGEMVPVAARDTGHLASMRQAIGAWSTKKKALVFGGLALGTSAVAIGAAVGATQGHGSSTPQTLNVLYAGSLVNLMQKSVGPAFTAQSGVVVNGTAAGSGLLATEIKNHTLLGDVFISADPKVDTNLMGDSNGNWVNWSINFANSPLVLGYNPNTTLGASVPSMPWYQALQQPNVRIGRTDPAIDPKGNLTVSLINQASTFYQDPSLMQQTLGSPENPAQIFPEQTLVTHVQSGELDVGFFYSIEAVEGHIPYVTFPTALAEHASYTITVLNRAMLSDDAVAFVAFVLGQDGETLLQKHGLNVTTPTVSGNATDVPSVLLKDVAGA